MVGVRLVTDGGCRQRQRRRKEKKESGPPWEVGDTGTHDTTDNCPASSPSQASLSPPAPPASLSACPALFLPSLSFPTPNPRSRSSSLPLALAVGQNHDLFLYLLALPLYFSRSVSLCRGVAITLSFSHNSLLSSSFSLCLYLSLSRGLTGAQPRSDHLPEGQFRRCRQAAGW